MSLSEHGHQRILITGVTGTLGRAVVDRLLADCGNNVAILGVSRDEQKQRTMPSDPRLTLRLADIRDYRSLKDAIDVWEGCQFHQVYHFAALKCVDTLESQPAEANRTNIKGTENVIRLARSAFSRVIMASTDKAVYPINAYGFSKAVAERLVLAEAHGQNTVVRYGNVIGSRGSILDTVVHSLTEHRRAQITRYDMTRFWWTIDDARDFVIGAGYGEKYGLLYPHWIRAASVHNFIKAVADVLGVTAYEMLPPSGKRPGEKIHECIAGTEETGDAPICSYDASRQMTAKELRHMIERALKKGHK